MPVSLVEEVVMLVELVMMEAALELLHLMPQDFRILHRIYYCEQAHVPERRFALLALTPHHIRYRI